jgi:hypothetical protein
VNLGPDEYTPFPIPCSASEVEALGDRDFRLLWTVEDLARSGLNCTLPEPEGLCHELDHGLKQLANFSRTRPAHPTSLKFGIH